MRRLVLILLVAMVGARGDVLRLKNGNTIEGKIVSETDKEIRIRTGTTEVTMPRAQVVEIERGEAPTEVYKRRAAEVKENDSEGHFALAQYCIEHRLFTEAIAQLRRVLEIQSGHKEARAKLLPLVDQRAAPLLAHARKLQEQGQYEEAEPPLVSIVDDYPDSSCVAAAQHLLAVGFAARKQYDVALTRWQRALALDPDLLDAYEGAAGAAAETGKWADALRFTERAAEVVKEPARAGRLRERAASLRQLVELQKGGEGKPADPVRLAAEGRVLLQLGQRERAFGLFLKAYDAGGRDPDLVKLLAEYCEQRGRVRQALELYKLLVAANPSNDELVRRRARIEKLLLVSDAFATREKARRERLLFDIAKSGASFAEVQAALRECTERPPVEKTGLAEGSFLVDEALTHATYTAYVPKAYDPRRPWPLILALHRDNDTGKEHFYNWEAAAATENYILVLPTAPGKPTGWKFHHIPLVLSALRHATKTYNIDTNRVVLAGAGSGGLLAWATAVRYPDLFAALVITNAPLDEVSHLYLAACANLPVYLLTGEQGSPEVVGSMRQAYATLEKWGYSVQREEVPGASRNPALPELNKKILPWLEDHARDPYASRVRLVSFQFADAKAFWVRIEKFASTVFDPDRKLSLKAPFGQEFSPEQLRMMYLGEMGKGMGQVAAAVAPGNRINIATKHVDELTVFLDDKMMDLEKPVRIYTNGELAFSGKVERSLEHLFESARYHRDPRMCYAASVRLKVREK